MLFIVISFFNQPKFDNPQAETEADELARLILFENYGDQKMIHREWESATKEYAEALKIVPDDLEITAKRQEALYNLCISEGKYCDLE